MNISRNISRSIAVVALLGASAVFAADPPKTKEKAAVYMTPEAGGIDYKIQGEFVGMAGSSKWGAQVLAMGHGKFHVVFEPGGLPGDGWDAKNRYESEGELKASTITLKPTDDVAWNEGHFPPPVEIKKGFEATLSDDTLTGKTDTGEAFTLKRTSRKSPTEGAKPPAGAIVLFDGSNVDAFSDGKIDADGFLKAGATTKRKWTDYTLHVEFCIPFKPTAKEQERGNSGVYNQKRYELQILDTFGLKGMDNQCGGMYTKNPPLVNMCYPPLTWQTYDLEFTAARYENGKRTAEATMTVKQNGVLVQDHYKLNGPTGAGAKEVPTEAINSGPLYLQDHGNPVRFRNVWIVDNSGKK